jgi:hypothetical protein
MGTVQRSKSGKVKVLYSFIEPTVSVQASEIFYNSWVMVRKYPSQFNTRLYAQKKITHQKTINSITKNVSTRRRISRRWYNELGGRVRWGRRIGRGVKWWGRRRGRRRGRRSERPRKIMLLRESGIAPPLKTQINKFLKTYRKTSV